MNTEEERVIFDMKITEKCLDKRYYLRWISRSGESSGKTENSGNRPLDRAKIEKSMGLHSENLGGSSSEMATEFFHEHFHLNDMKLIF